MANREDQETHQKSGIAYAAAINLFACVVAMAGLGWLVDHWRETTPWFLVAGIVLGAVVGFYQFVRLTSKLS